MDEKHQKLLVNNVHTFDFKHDIQVFKFTTKEERDPQFLIQIYFVIFAYVKAAMPVFRAATTD